MTNKDAIVALTAEIRRLREVVERRHFEEDVREPAVLREILDAVEGLRDSIGEVAGGVAREESNNTVEQVRMILRDHIGAIRAELAKK
jgi:hypothetical protein